MPKSLALSKTGAMCEGNALDFFWKNPYYIVVYNTYFISLRYNVKMSASSKLDFGHMPLSMIYGINLRAAKPFEVTLRQQYNTVENSLLCLPLPLYLTLETLFVKKTIDGGNKDPV